MKNDQQLEPLYSLTIALGTTLDLAHETAAFMEWLAEVVEPSVAALFITDEAKQEFWLMGACGFEPPPEARLPLGLDLWHWLAEQQVSVPAEGDTRRYAVPIPIEQQLFGTLCLGSSRPAEQLADEQRLVKTAAGYLAPVLRNIHRYQTLGQRVAERTAALTALNTVAAVVSQSLNLQETLTAALEATLEATDFEVGGIALWDEKEQRLQRMITKGVETGVAAVFVSPLRTGGNRERVLSTGQPVFHDDTTHDPQVHPEIARYGFTISAIVPLAYKKKVLGILAVATRAPRQWTEEDKTLLTAVGQQIGVAIANAQLMQDLRNSLEELKQTQAQLLQLQKMEALGQLAAGIAHDFNNLLTPMGGFADLLLGKAPEGSKEHEYLRQIKVSAQRAADLTGQLRLFTRQEKGERRPVQLNSLVEETRDLLERSIPKRITIELHLEPELWAVEADPSQMSQVLMNLSVNARDAMPEGGTLTLETRNVTLDEEYARMVLEARPGRYVCLSVADSGCGMSPEVQARLFEPFFTTKGVGEGTGLGLAVVYGIVKGHDGFIQVYSQEGRGSTFHVYLPALEGAVEEREVERVEWPTGTETVLVVDDEEGLRALGQAVLEPCGYTVLMAKDGAQALEVYQAHQEDIGLVVLDVIMPQMGGQECLRRLREMNPEVKVLISTGYTARGLAQELVAEGALGIVEKPFQIRDFAVAVRAALDKP